MRQPQTRNWSAESQLKTSTARLARKNPAGAPNCGQEAMKPRLRSVRAHSIASNTEPPHSPPTPIPWIKRITVSRTAPQMPMLSYVGTRPTATVARPVTSNVAIRVALRPIRSPQWPNIAAPIGRPTNPMKKTANASSTPTSGSDLGKKSLPKTRAVTWP